ncbi:mif4g domain protein, partial [Ichthyophthirius multifiliis]
MDVSEEILKLFQEKYVIKALRLDLKSQNIRAKDNYSNINFGNRTSKLTLVQRFLNKLKTSNPKDRDSILNEIDNYHLQNYINDISNFISDQTVTDNDIPYFMQLCSKLHQTYEEFAGTLITNITRQIKTNIKLKEKDDKIISIKRREMMRFLCELFVIGFPVSFEKVMECLREIISQKDSKSILLNVQTALMFSTQFAFEIFGKRGFKLGYYHEKYENLPNIFNFDYQIIPQEKILKILQSMQQYIYRLTEQLKQLYEQKQVLSEKVKKILEEEGEIFEKDVELQYNRTIKNYKQLFEALSTIADCLELEFCVDFGENEAEIKQKKLVRDILEYRKEYNLMVPQLCRFVAVVSKYFKDLADFLVDKVIKDFNIYKEKNRQDFSFRDKKIRYLKYLCELVKFKVVDLGKILDILKSLIDDFSTQQIDLVCAILDNCGRFLYKCNESRFRYCGLLDNLQWKLQKANLPTNKLIQLENSINLSKPSKKRQIKAPKEETEEQKFINYLIFYVLNIQNFKQVTEVLSNMNWNEQLEQYCFKAIMKKMTKGKVDQIQLCAGVISFLNKLRPSITIKIVDELIERTIFGMETNQVQEQQKRINVIRLLSELYIFNVLEIDFIFTVLYMILNFGHEDFRDIEEQQRIDGEEDLFRISMVCNMIEPIQDYLRKKKNFQTTLKFLVNFHKYILSKKYVPIDIEFMILDTFDTLDDSQRFTKIKNFEQASELVIKVNSEQNQKEKQKILLVNMLVLLEKQKKIYNKNKNKNKSKNKNVNNNMIKNRLKKLIKKKKEKIQFFKHKQNYLKENLKIQQ